MTSLSEIKSKVEQLLKHLGEKEGWPVVCKVYGHNYDCDEWGSTTSCNRCDKSEHQILLEAGETVIHDPDYGYYIEKCNCSRGCGLIHARRRRYYDRSKSIT